MKVQKVWLALGLALFAACGGPGGGGNQGGMSQQEFGQALDEHTQTQQQVVQQLIQDPAFQAFLGNPMDGLSLESLALAPFGGTLPGFFPFPGLRPLNHPSENHALPRGGWDYTADPNNPTPYDPRSPYDLGVKWTASGQVAELLVDWDNGRATLWPHDQSGQSWEAPQAAQAHMTLGDDEVGHADFEATWYNCSAASTYILEPTRLAFSGYLGQTAQLNWDASYQLTEGAQDRIQAALDLSTQGTNPTSGLSLELTLNGQLTRGANCFTQSFQPQSGSFTLTSQVGSENMVFQLQVTNVQWNPDGRPIRVDLNGYVDHNNQRAVSFSGYLDEEDLNGTDPCPGEDVTLTFRDGSVSLEAWLQDQGACRP